MTHKKPKIAIINVCFAPQLIGGATRVVMDNIDDLLLRYGDEFDYVVFTSDTDMQEEAHQLNCFTYRGIRVYRPSVIFRENMDWHPRDEAMGDIFSEFLQFEKPDLIHFHCIQRLTASIVQAAWMLNIPYVVTAHDAWWISDFQFLVDGNDKVYPNGHITPISASALPDSISLSASKKRIELLKRLLNQSARVLTVSNVFKAIYEANGIANVTVTKNGLSRETNWQPKNTTHTEKVVCAHIGGMSPHKGYDILESAIRETQPQNIEMLIVDHSEPDGFVKKDSWGDVPVTYIGRMKQENIVSLYQSIDVLFAPSIWPESFGLVTREAAACNCWIVASNMGGIGEDVIDGVTGRVIEPTQVALEHVIQEIDADANKYKQPAPVPDRHYVTEQVDELITIYREIISSES